MSNNNEYKQYWCLHCGFITPLSTGLNHCLYSYMSMILQGLQRGYDNPFSFFMVMLHELLHAAGFSDINFD